MSSVGIKNVAGMSLGGGSKENFFLALLEFYQDRGRWFLKSLHQVKEEEMSDRDEIIKNWIEQYSIRQLLVDFPLSKSPCETCTIKCPGASICPHPAVMAVRDEMQSLLDEDAKLYNENPKWYEQERQKIAEFDHGRNLLSKQTAHHILSRSFKRKLRKGFIPYWHRPIDFWVWCNYYDQLLEVFKNTYDSFGHVSLMLLSRLNYLVRHLPIDLTMFESSTQICLLELYRAKIVGKQTLMQLFDLELAPIARETIIIGIEKHLGIFIYEKDLDVIVRNPQAFDSFLLAVVGQRMLMSSTHEIPLWGNADRGNFIVPKFA